MVEQLSDEELEDLRALLLASNSQRWLISAIAGASRWIAIVIAGWLAAKGLLSEVMAWPK